MSIHETPIPVEFPLRGEWTAINTPGHRIPSHGTHLLAQTYAYDLIRLDRSVPGMKYFEGPSLLHYVFLGVKLEHCYGWGQPIHAPFPGEVVAARDGWPERDPSHIFRDLGIVMWNWVAFGRKARRDLRRVAGNHLIIKARGRDVYAFIAHCQLGSLRVKEGHSVGSGDHLANVGHSGNSTAPHLHFHLMDSADVHTAKGLPCCFETYETLSGDSWRPINLGIPKRREFIRYGV